MKKAWSCLASEALIRPRPDFVLEDSQQSVPNWGKSRSPHLRNPDRGRNAFGIHSLPLQNLQPCLRGLSHASKWHTFTLDIEIVDLVLSWSLTLSWKHRGLSCPVFLSKAANLRAAWAQAGGVQSKACPGKWGRTSKHWKPTTTSDSMRREIRYLIILIINIIKSITQDLDFSNDEWVYFFNGSKNNINYKQDNWMREIIK